MATINEDYAIFNGGEAFGVYINGPWSAGFSRQKYRYRYYQSGGAAEPYSFFVPLKNSAERERVLLYIHDSSAISSETVGWGSTSGINGGQIVIVNKSMDPYCWSGAAAASQVSDPAGCPSGWSDLGVAFATSTTTQINNMTAGANDFNIGSGGTALQKLSYSLTYNGGNFGPDTVRPTYGCPSSFPYKNYKVRTCGYQISGAFILT